MSLEDDKNISLSRFLAENYNNTCQKRKSIRNSFFSNSCKSLNGIEFNSDFEDNPKNVSNTK
jgi:hypothetical protein